MGKCFHKNTKYPYDDITSPPSACDTRQSVSKTFSTLGQQGMGIGSIGDLPVTLATGLQERNPIPITKETTCNQAKYFPCSDVNKYFAWRL